MKRYRFRLEKVLRVRRLQEEQQRARVLEARAEADRAGAAVEEAVERYRVAAHAHGRMSAEELRRHQQLHELQAMAVQAARQHEAAALDLLAVRVAGWQEADVRVKVLERLDARRRAEHALEAQREAERTVDDLVTARLARRDGQTSPGEDRA